LTEVHFFLDKDHKTNKMDKKPIGLHMIPQSNLLSTGKASKLLSVTPDTVLKWIKQEKLPAVRTAGGHYRVPQGAIDALLNIPTDKPAHQASFPSDTLRYCWEFFSEDGKARRGCQNCLVFRSHALKCFEMNHLPKDMGFNGGICASSCESCAYYRYHQGRPFKVLVVTDNPGCRESLSQKTGSHNIQFQFVNCEYESSMVVDRFRPDFVVVDCTMQEMKCRELCHHLTNDPRIPDATLILATPPRRHVLSIPGAIRVRNPISLKELESHLSRLRMCHLIPAKEDRAEGNFKS
jgi:excisionase family DNA binding protein